jgi:hypothetical protein
MKHKDIYFHDDIEVSMRRWGTKYVGARRIRFYADPDCWTTYWFVVLPFGLELGVHVPTRIVSLLERKQ